MEFRWFAHGFLMNSKKLLIEKMLKESPRNCCSCRILWTCGID